MFLQKIGLREELPLLEQAKQHLRVDGNEEDSYITSLITAAREAIEDYTLSSIALQELEARYNKVNGVLLLPRPPIQEIISVTVDGVDVTEACSLISTRAVYFDQPFQASRPGGVVIRYVAGYADVPQVLKQAILLLVAHLYESREGQASEVKYSAQIPSGVSLPPTVAQLVCRYRVWLV